MSSPAGAKAVFVAVVVVGILVAIPLAAFIVSYQLGPPVAGNWGEFARVSAPFFVSASALATGIVALFNTTRTLAEQRKLQSEQQTFQEQTHLKQQQFQHEMRQKQEDFQKDMQTREQDFQTKLTMRQTELEVYRAGLEKELEAYEKLLKAAQGYFRALHPIAAGEKDTAALREVTKEVRSVEHLKYMIAPDDQELWTKFIEWAHYVRETVEGISDDDDGALESVWKDSHEVLAQRLRAYADVVRGHVNKLKTPP